MIAGLCLYESLTNGVLGLHDVALMNDALDVKAENERIIKEAMDRR